MLPSSVATWMDGRPLTVYFLVHCSALAGEAAARAARDMVRTHNKRPALDARPRAKSGRAVISDSAWKSGCREQLFSLCVSSTFAIRNEGRVAKVPWFVALLQGLPATGRGCGLRVGFGPKSCQES